MAKKIVSTNLVAALLVVIAVLGYGLIGKAGNLEPSAAPGPTMKTLDEVEPRIPIPGSDTVVTQFAINQSGSYYLTGDRLCTGIGIYVGVDDVTIDLMGHSLIGLGTNGNSGIRLSGRSNVEIRNGTIRDFGWRAIADFSANISKNNRVINIRAISNGQYASGYDGISLPGTGHLIKDCTTAYNGKYGITVGKGCTVTGNISHNNAGNGIYTQEGSTITGNTCYSNDGYGIFALSYSVVDQNTAYGNASGTDIFAGTGCAVGLNVGP